MIKPTLEERVTRLEKLIFEDAIDDELDSMANDILTKDTKSRHNTIRDWLESIVFDSLKEEYPSQFIINNLQILLDDIEAFNSFKSIRVINLMKNQIREISDLSYLKAKKLVSDAVKKRISVEKERLYNQLNKFKEFIDGCTSAIRKEIDTSKYGKLWDIEDPRFNDSKPIASFIIRRSKPFTYKTDHYIYIVREYVSNGKTLYDYETDVSTRKGLSKDELRKELARHATTSINDIESL